MFHWAVLCVFLVGLLNAAAASDCADFARSEDVKVSDVYRARVRPGYCCWVCTWTDPKGALYVSFVEKRKAPNTQWEPVPLDFWESMGLPAGYQTAFSNGDKNVVYEIVVLKSVDNGATWKETGRQSSKMDNTFSWVSLKDGSFLRSQSNDYIAWHKGERQQTWCEISKDGGKSWTRRSVIFYGHNGSGSPHRLRKLKDGTLVQLIPAVPEFGPGKERFSRHTKRPNVRQELSVFLYFSKDEGRTWVGPMPVLPGVLAWEPDFVQLPSGDLVVLNSTVQGGPQVRQYVRKTELGWIPGPLYDVVSGRVPETIVCTKEGILVGAVRGGEFTCSNDDGANWYHIANVANAGYQPFVTQMSDGRIFCAWHGGGGDEPVGKTDLHVGSTVFRLAASLPAPTKLEITRDLSESGDRYINSYTLTLTSGGHVAGKTIHLHYDKRYGGTAELTAVTDQKGRAKFDLSDVFKGETNIHLSYTLYGWFKPDASDTSLAPCQSDTYTAYAITSTKQELGLP